MNNAIAVVTGTSSGVGAATARQLVERGWTVVGVARRAAAIDDSRYTHVTLDLADVRALPAAFEAAVAPKLAAERWTRVALVNNAARADLLHPLPRLDPSQLLEMLALNTVAPMWLMGFIARRAPRETALRIVNVSTGGAVIAYPGLAAYGASKAALRMAGQVFAAELESAAGRAEAPENTAILSYQPGTVDTAMQAHARSREDDEFPWAQLFRDFHARGVLVAPEAPAAKTWRSSNRRRSLA